MGVLDKHASTAYSAFDSNYIFAGQLFGNLIYEILRNTLTVADFLDGQAIGFCFKKRAN